MEYRIVSFANTHGAMAAEKHLKKQFKIVTLPTPREISRGCGIAIRFGAEDYDSVCEILTSSNLDKALYSIYHFADGTFTKQL